jgi:hypothetical protein
MTQMIEFTASTQAALTGPRKKRGAGKSYILRLRRPVLIAVSSTFGLFGANATAGGLTYDAILPQFGGTNGQALSILQFEKQMADTKTAKSEAAIKEAERLANVVVLTPTDQLVAALIRNLDNQIAQRFAAEILDGTSPTGSFSAGDVQINYVRLDGILTLDITDANGTTTISLPMVGGL